VFVHSNDVYRTVIDLFESGRSDYEIARMVGVPRSTVQKWRHTDPALRRATSTVTHWRAAEPELYCYALGLYLGDGHIVVRNARPRFLRLFLDAAYPELVDEAAQAFERVFSPARVHHYDWGRENRIILQLSHRALLVAFPQHGPGKKHSRRIELSDWQRELTHANPGALVRGLIHSDGCRTVNRFKTRLPSGRVAEYAYPRYFFSNLSPDIRSIFVEHCELLGVRCTQSNPRNVSISHRRSVAILEEVVGPKR
jgi:hypothetical protein